MRLSRAHPFAGPVPGEARLGIGLDVHDPGQVVSGYLRVAAFSGCVVVEMLADVAEAGQVRNTIIELGDAVAECSLELADAPGKPDRTAEAGQGDEKKVEIDFLAPDFGAKSIAAVKWLLAGVIGKWPGDAAVLHVNGIHPSARVDHHGLD